MGKRTRQLVDWLTLEDVKGYLSVSHGQHDGQLKRLLRTSLHLAVDATARACANEESWQEDLTHEFDGFVPSTHLLMLVDWPEAVTLTYRIEGDPADTVDSPRVVFDADLGTAVLTPQNVGAKLEAGTLVTCQWTQKGELSQQDKVGTWRLDFIERIYNRGDPESSAAQGLLATASRITSG